MILFDKIGYAFKNPRLLERALTHKSYYFEHMQSSDGHYERLEFLGDAVLDLVLTADLLKRFPELSEGDLSKIRASLVNESVLSEIAKETAVAEEMRLGRGEKNSGGATKPRLLASVFEAVAGAFFLDAGYDAADELLKGVFKSRLDGLDLDHFFKADYKTRLQEILQARERRIPVYELEKEEGPDHEKTFYVHLKIGDRLVAIGSGKSKKQAEQDAARIALESDEFNSSNGGGK